MTSEYQPQSEETRESQTHPHADLTTWLTISECEPAQANINTESEIADECPVYEHADTRSKTVSDGIKKLLDAYDASGSNTVSLGNTYHKAHTATHLLKNTQCSLIELEPWFVSEHMGDTEFDRWEPFCLGQIETSVADRQLKVTQLAPLSEISYRLTHKPNTATTGDSSGLVTGDVTPATLAEYEALTRHRLASSYNGPQEEDPDKCGAILDMGLIRAIHTVASPHPSTGHLIVGSQTDGSLYCGRGRLDGERVDVQIELGWRTGEYGEEKVAVYNTRATKGAVSDLPWEKTHARYLGNKHRWEVDFNSIETVLVELLSHDSVDFVSLHRATEKLYEQTTNGSFETKMSGYTS